MTKSFANVNEREIKRGKGIDETPLGDSFAKSIRIVFSLSSVEKRKKKFSKSLSNKPKNEGHLMQQVALNWIPVGNYHFLLKPKVEFIISVSI